jgi:hypothetical protein
MLDNGGFGPKKHCLAVKLKPDYSYNAEKDPLPMGVCRSNQNRAHNFGAALPDRHQLSKMTQPGCLRG